MINVLKHEALKQLLQKNWANILDATQVLRFVMEKVRDTEFKQIKQAEIPARQTQISVSSMTLRPDESWFDLCIEFSVPKDDGVVIGTLRCYLSFIGDLSYGHIFGTHFVPQSP